MEVCASFPAVPIAPLAIVLMGAGLKLWWEEGAQGSAEQKVTDAEGAAVFGWSHSVMKSCLCMSSCGLCWLGTYGLIHAAKGPGLTAMPPLPGGKLFWLGGLGSQHSKREPERNCVLSIKTDHASVSVTNMLQPFPCG